MIFRILLLVAITVCGGLDVAWSAPGAMSAPDASAAPGATIEADLSDYRRYAKAQAEILVGMTKILAGDIAEGDLGAAQATYAPAHAYLERLAPIARAFPDLNKAMDAQADAYETKQADPHFAGFHRIEYGLFTNKSTKDLSVVADRLVADARALRDRAGRLDVTPAVLLDGTIAHIGDMADKSLAGDEEPYARADLWDVEASIEGARQVVALSKPQPQNAETRASIAAHLATIEAVLDKHKDGCGYQSYDALSRDDRMALRTPLAALAMALARLRNTSAID